jgi:tetratricopeptide (TPR) repeat protein
MKDEGVRARAAPGAGRAVGKVAAIISEVEGERGDWILIRSTNGPGWVRKGDSVLLEQAEHFFTRRIREDPTDGWAYAARAAVYQRHGEYDLALEGLDRVIGRHPFSSDLLIQRGNVRADKKEYDKAIADYTEALRHNPDFASGYANRSLLLWREKRDYARALADFDEFLRREPGNFGVWLFGARILATCPDAKCRDGKKAIIAARWACELSGWGNPAALETLAAAYAEAGDFEQAIRWQRKALEDESYARGDGDRARRLLKLYGEGKPYREE